MNKSAKKPLLIGLGVVALVAIAFYFMKNQTKSYSPEDTVTYTEEDLELEVFYNRPYKKGREIFGGLVPYNEVWRTGANEATTFTTNKDIYIDGSLLEAGKYTLWTIPGPESWKVIFNSEMYSWGITTNQEASRIAEYDVLTLEVPVNKTFNTIEQFSIFFESANDFFLMHLAWDDTVVTVPIRDAEDVEQDLIEEPQDVEENLQLAE